MTYRRRYRLTRTALVIVATAHLTTVWPAGNTPPAPAATVDHVELHRTGTWWPCWAVDVPCGEH